MSADTDVPTDVDIDRASHVALTWADGTHARLELDELRQACPCAECRDRREHGRPVWTPGRQPLQIVDAELVGGWGLSVTWSDGHSTGIYSWEILRAWATT